MTDQEDRRVKMTKRLLKDALIELLATKDIYHLSIRELCEKADVNRTTFYKHYTSQFDLLTDMENDLIVLVNEAIAKNANRRERIIEEACRYLEENLQFARLLINNNVDPAFPQKLFSLTTIREAVVKNVKTDDDPALLPYGYVYQTYGAYQVISQWLNKDRREAPKDFARLLIKIMA